MFNDKLLNMFEKQQVIYLAGGCFWGVEAFISRLKGVNSTEVGYANGNDLAPTYEKVCSGKTGHAETVKATYNPKIIALDEILAWSIIIIVFVGICEVIIKRISKTMEY